MLGHDYINIEAPLTVTFQYGEVLIEDEPTFNICREGLENLFIL